ncbi:META domain-containing protein [Dyadobacter sp. LHD-138]|uniref:META domain-containing protein n=1 Tax=Dyadobacter sp. LHD-138 TaxID=3071413 RepID=UPI0027E0A46F|nr:META domain-containing protein [Dyadobacter sp. LHD-138]MDQ6481732.1 META domain-containing protein [Dyadobacter sp. LHD-138]
MKKFFIAAFICLSFLPSCKNSKMSSKPAATSSVASLEGTWVLNYLMVPGKSFDELYADKKPEITFEVKENRFSGNTSCNSFSGKLNADGHKISFRDPYAMTRMMCQGDGENVFTEALKKVNTYAVSDGTTLNFISGDIAMMRFTKK